jgi:hypothetical protein
MKILIVLTSHDQLGDTGGKAGFWPEELAAIFRRRFLLRRTWPDMAHAR